ncbi:MAG: bifunctional phosphopantothenoylcysteine decarboxylase/phosphopantothenate--cysteine ligase CoaBC, partial [Candidatus Mariimomonas ferrooxydans]
MLKGKKILLAVTGSIAAYKSIDLARGLTEAGADLTVVMTESACRFVPPLPFEMVSGRPVYVNLFEGHFMHLNLVKEADLLIIAPATANTINKFACGIADNLLSTLWLAHEGHTLIAPAMNSKMYENPIVKKSLGKLAKMGVKFSGPVSGKLACGDEGAGRMAEITDIMEAVKSILSVKDLSGHNILVTAGPTREPIDSVRFISNRSSGKMGFAVATATFRRGANVTLISGPTAQEPPKGISYIPVERAVDMETAVLKNLHKSTSVIMTAAVSDFAPSLIVKSKIPKTKEITINLKKTPDILQKIGEKKGNRLIIGFAAETGKNIKKAKEKLKNKALDLIVLNDITRKGAGFDVNTNIVTIIDKRGEITDYPSSPHYLNHHSPLHLHTTSTITHPYTSTLP